MYMKRIPIILAFILIFAVISVSVRADDWNSVYDSYNEAEYGKSISEQDYQKALEVMEKYSDKKDKKARDKEKKAEKDINKEKEPKIIFDSPPSDNSLLTLFTDVSHNGKLIERGFYLVSAINKNNKHFLRLTRGEGRVIAEIEAHPLEKADVDKKVFSEIMDNGILKLTYTDRNVILEAYLWIQ